MAYPYIWGIVENGEARIKYGDTEAKEVVLGKDDFAFVGGSISNLDELKRVTHAHGSAGAEELVCALFRQQGDQGLSLLKGDFVIVHWRGDGQALTLVRDKFGIHNIYYALLDKGSFIFSTRLRQLVHTSLVSKEIDPNALYMFFSLGIILPPRTIYQEVHSLEPGQYLRYQEGKVEKHTYFNFDLPGEKVEDRSWLVARCQQVLENAVRRACGEASKVGIYLSGGIDSALLLALARRGGKEVFAFSMGPWGETSSDLAYARLSASFNGVPHFEWHAAAKDLNHLPYIVALLEQPNSDPAALSYYLLAQEAKKHDIAVMLSGQSADTVIGAMHYLKYILWSERCRRYLPHHLSQLLLKLGRLLPEGRLKNQLSFLLTPGHCVDKLLYFKVGSFPRYKDRLFPFPGQMDESRVFQFIYDAANQKAESDLIDRLVYLDARFTEQQRCLEVLQKSANGVTVKLPFFDQEVVDFALKIPNKFRAEASWDKMVLRDAAKSLVHPQLYRKPKKALVFPTHKWFGDTLSERVLQYLKSSDFLNEFVRTDELVNIFRQRQYDYGDIIYRVLLLAIWYRLNFEFDSEVSRDTSLKEVLGFDLLGLEKSEPR
jgi:asparagine synthase (glutamine-hydrolysing)